MSEVDLAPCPFCGGPAEKRVTDGPKRGFIGCFTCMIGLSFNVPYGDAEVATWNTRSRAAIVPPELTALQVAYNQAIEDVKTVIRATNVDDPYAAATFINAIARTCSPYRYVPSLPLPELPTEEQAEAILQALTTVDTQKEIEKCPETC